MEHTNGSGEETRWERPDAPLGTLVYRAGLLSKDKLESAIEEGRKSGRRLGEILLQKNWIEEKDLARLLAGQKGLPFVSLRGRGFDEETARALPERVCRFHNAMAVELEGEDLLVAIADPGNEDAVGDIRRELRRPFRLVVATPTEIRAALDQIFGNGRPEGYSAPPLAVGPVLSGAPSGLPAEPVSGLRIAAPPSPEPAPSGDASPEASPVTLPASESELLATPAAPEAAELLRAPAQPEPTLSMPATPEPVPAAADVAPTSDESEDPLAAGALVVAPPEPAFVPPADVAHASGEGEDPLAAGALVVAPPPEPVFVAPADDARANDEGEEPVAAGALLVAPPEPAPAEDSHDPYDVRPLPTEEPAEESPNGLPRIRIEHVAPPEPPREESPLPPPTGWEPRIERNEDAHVSVAFHAPTADEAAAPEPPAPAPNGSEPAPGAATEPTSPAPAPPPVERNVAADPFRIVLELDGDEELDVATFPDEAAAAEGAREFIARLARRDEWPMIGNRFVRPERIKAIEIRERQRFAGARGRALWGASSADARADD